MDFHPYRIEPVRRNSRRCIGHDYCEPCIYMITATPIYCINAVYNFYIW